LVSCIKRTCYFFINCNFNIEKFSPEIRCKSNEGYIFDFEVIGNVTGKKSLKIESNSLPEDFQYVVVNPQSKTKYDSDKIDLYLNKNRLQLIVGNEDFINSKTMEYQFVPSAFRLDQNYPNPFNPSTSINYELPNYSKLSINIYNILGQKIKSLLKKGEKEAGYYQIIWDGKNDFGKKVASGIYILNFQSDQFSKSLKMVLQK